ncbi:MAG TPA: hypothetical protein VMG12_18420 [Polyangiaceae bacterium]|nr:hypothetical protein [Polyangiaceae bacterium]
MGWWKPSVSSVCRWVAAAALSLGCAANRLERPPAATQAAQSTPPSGATSSGERWLELETPHFVVHTDSYPERAIELTKQMEQARAMLLAAAWPMARDPGGRTHVLIFAKPSDFKRYSGMPGMTVGVAITRSDTDRTIAFTPGADGGVPQVAIHELAHDLSQWFLPLQPAWLAEGLAVYLQNTRYDAAKGQVVMGEASEDSLRWLKEAKFFASAQKLFGQTSPHSDDPRDVATFYVGSWFLVTYLMNGQIEAFNGFQKQLHQLVPWRRAWDESFAGMTTAELDQRLVGYAKQGGNITIVSIDAQLPVVEPELRALSAAQSHGVKALLASSFAPEVAERELQAALALDPNELHALAAQFRAASDNGSPALLRGIAERAVAAHPDAGEAWYLQAQVATEAAAQRRALVQAAKLAPKHPGVALLVAESALANGNAARALELARYAMRRTALSPRLLGLYAAALEGTGRCQEATAIAANSSDLFSSGCSWRSSKESPEMSCAAYVQSRIGSPLAPCQPKPASARAATH